MVTTIKNAFTPEECAKLRSYFLNPEEGKILRGELSDVRKSEVCFLKDRKEAEWIYTKLRSILMQINAMRYSMVLFDFSENLQLGKYGIGGKYDWHEDYAPGFPIPRKLSAVIQLSEPSEYTGGDLEFNDEVATRGLGDLIVFPSTLSHRVTEVTCGERFSLVAWLSGIKA